MGMVLGAGAGMAFGTAIDDLTVGMIAGISIGAAIGLAFETKRNK